MFDNIREIKIIEALYNEKLIGKFVDMRTARNHLGVLADKVSYRFATTLNEKRDSKQFWEILRNGMILENKKVRVK